MAGQPFCARLSLDVSRGIAASMSGLFSRVNSLGAHPTHARLSLDVGREAAVSMSRLFSRVHRMRTRSTGKPGVKDRALLLAA